MSVMFEKGGKNLVQLHRNVTRIIGITTCLVGAFLMAFGGPIIGPKHTGVATVVGIIGIGLITTGKTTSVVKNKLEET